MSKFKQETFKKEDIKGYIIVDGRRSIYLKEGIRNKILNPIQDPNKLENHINDELIHYERFNFFYTEIMGLDDYENNN